MVGEPIDLKYSELFYGLYGLAEVGINEVEGA